MAATMAGVSLSTPRVIFKGPESLQKSQTIRLGPVFMLNQRWTGTVSLGRMVTIQPVRATPEGKTGVEESIKQAEEKCSEDATSGECAAAWDEVEELSAAASHARDKKKESSDPLEAYCKDNPETDECRTYDN